MLAHAPFALASKENTGSIVDCNMVRGWLQLDLCENTINMTAGSIRPSTAALKKSIVNLTVIDCNNRILTTLPNAAPYVTWSYV